MTAHGPWPTFPSRPEVHFASEVVVHIEGYGMLQLMRFVSYPIIGPSDAV
jgi:hypothetical protein